MFSLKTFWGLNGRSETAWTELVLQDEIMRIEFLPNSLERHTGADGRDAPKV